MRAGGATELIIRGDDIGRIQFLGRWRSNAILQAYIQEAVSSFGLDTFESERS